MADKEITINVHARWCADKHNEHIAAGEFMLTSAQNLMDKAPMPGMNEQLVVTATMFVAIATAHFAAATAYASTKE